MKDTLTQFVGDWLGSADCWIDEVESVLERHLEQELAQYIAREPAREDEFRKYFESERATGVVGDVVAATTPLDETRAEAVMAQVGKLGAIQIPVAEFLGNLRTLEDFRFRYERRDNLHAALPAVGQALREWCSAAREAQEVAVGEFTAYVKSLPEEARRLGKTVGDKTLLSMTDVAVFTGTSVGAARKLIREKKLPVYRIGKRKYVLLKALLDATREESAPVAPQA